MRTAAGQPCTVRVAVDVATLCIPDGDFRVLMARRAATPYQGFWTLPGERKRPGVALDAEARELLERATAGHVRYIEQLKTFDRPEQRDAGGVISVPGRDPRGDVVSVAYLGLVEPVDLRPEAAGEPTWHPIRSLPEDIGFDHRTIIDYAVRRLRGKIRYSSVAFALLHEEFTLPDLHRLYEQILGRTLHRGNFQRDVLRSGVVEPIGERHGGRGRPAHVYRFRNRSFGLLEEPEGFE